MKPRAKKLLKFFAVLLCVIVFVGLSFMFMTVWSANGGNIQSLSAKSSAVSRFSTYIQIALLIVVWLEWPRIVKRYCATPSGIAGMLSIRHWFCGFFLLFEIIFYFV